jgi:hypothetical protein
MVATLTEKQIKRGAHRSTRALEADIESIGPFSRVEQRRTSGSVGKDGAGGSGVSPARRVEPE